jgi:hypothetical protein
VAAHPAPCPAAGVPLPAPELAADAARLPPTGSGAAPSADLARQLEALAARLADSRVDAGPPQASLPRVYGWLTTAAGWRWVKCLLD